MSGSPKTSQKCLKDRLRKDSSSREIPPNAMSSHTQVGQSVGQNGLLMLGKGNALTPQFPWGIWCMVLGNKCSQTADAALTQQTPATNAASTQQNSATNTRSGTHLTQMWHDLIWAMSARTAVELLSNQVLMFCCRKCVDVESNEPLKHQPSHNRILKLVISLSYHL